MNRRAEEVIRGLAGAGRLARFDKSGLAFFDASYEGAWRSFFACVLAAPGFAILVLASLDPGADTARGLAAGLIAYAIEVAFFPLIMRHVAHGLERLEHWPRFVAAANWSILVQLAYHLIALVAVELLPAPVGGHIALSFFGLALLYAWYIARVALDIAGMQAAGVVALSLVISLALSSLSRAMA
ncbi:MAG: hypothetical protein FJX51_04060 [Alphaproteobacteria bacterium]|nr:hypothetical protein [Alphaproteobacteria bacterium]